MSYLGVYISSILSNKRVKAGFLGLGKSNLALMRELSRFVECDIVLRDNRDDPKISGDVPIGVRMFGKNALRDIDEDILFLSPSVRRDSPELLDANSRGVILTSDCELFYDFNTTPTIGITGSDGKSTVTTLTSLLLREEGYSSCAIGNIGVPYIDAPDSDYLVSELSSFNLQYLSPRLFRAAITNITPNHLNWHTSFEEYTRAKKNILKNAEYTVLSADDALCSEIIQEEGASSVFSIRKSYDELKQCCQADVYYTCSAEAIERLGKPIIMLADLPQHEDYYYKNVMCALALTDGLVSDEAAKAVLRTFRGLEHRCEEFLRISGISFINSSIDTTPMRTATTVSSLKRNVRIILGGRGKGLSYQPLIDPLIRYADRISLYGDAADELLEVLKSEKALSNIEIGIFQTFSDCVSHALCGTTCGDTVLLSPACTAYGEFRDYTERGSRFKEIIKNMYKIV